MFSLISSNAFCTFFSTVSLMCFNSFNRKYPFLRLRSLRNGYFRLNELKHMSETVEKKVQKALDEIRLNIQADGGDIELVAVEKGVVKVRLQGHCAGCPMSAMTLKNGVEAHLKMRVLEVLKVEAVR